MTLEQAPSSSSSPADGPGADSLCPPAEALERFHRGGATADEAARLRGHLARCVDCGRVFAGISAEPVAAAEPPVGFTTQILVDRLAAAPPPKIPCAEPVPAIDGFDGFQEIGRGGMGIVWRAREVRLDRPVAIKVLTTVAALSDKARARAEHEARVLARIAHPNIVRIFGLTSCDGAPAIVMEWIEGAPLAAGHRPHPLPLRQAVSLVRALADAVAALHAAGIVHRDITPANVLLSPGGDGAAPRPVLVDFGLAVGAAETTAAGTLHGVAMGTPSFMAPEQTGLDPALGSISAATDIHALGGLLAWLLSGRAPYEAATTVATLHRAAGGDALPLAALVPGLPVDLGTIVATCLARQPDKRYHSAAALADDLGRFLDGRPILARRAGPPERVLAWIRRRPAAAALAASAAVAAALLAAGAVHHARSLAAARAVLAAKHDEAVAAAALARESFERLTNSSAERLLARGTALDVADRDYLRHVRDRYRDWPLEPDAAAALEFRAAGLVRVTGLFAALHWPDDAIETARAAAAAADELASRGIATPEAISQGCRMRRLERGFLADAGRTDEAIAAARAAIALLEARVGREPALERHLAVAWCDLGATEGISGRLAEGRAHQERGLAMLDGLLARTPDDAEAARLSLSVLHNAAINAAFQADPAARRALLATLVERSAAGLERFPADATDFGRGLVFGLGILGRMDLDEGRPTEALEKARRRAAAARQLAGRSPHRRQFLDEVINTAPQILRCLETLGRPAEAEGDLDEADVLATEGVAAEPAVKQRTWVLVNALRAKAAMYLATGRPAEALAVQRRLLAAMLPWAKDGAGEPFQTSVKDVHAEIARLEAGDGAGAGTAAAAAN